MGAQVTPAFRDALAAAGFDHDLRTRLTQALTARGITLAGGMNLQSLLCVRAGLALQRVHGSRLNADAALDVAGLGASETGVHFDTRGVVALDLDSRPTAQGIWAIDDVTGRRAIRVDRRTVHPLQRWA